MSPLPSGTLLQNRFLINKVLGRGGFAYTYEGHDNRLERAVAIKEFSPSENGKTLCVRSGQDIMALDMGSVAFAEYRDRFYEEARLLATIRHPGGGVVVVHDFFLENNTAYMVMELLEGVTLYNSSHKKPLPIDDALSLLRRIADPLAFVHALNIIHRDLNPKNIILTKDKRFTEDNRVVLIDFGLAKINIAQTQTLTAMCFPGFAPPEQYQGGRGKPHPTMDIYSLCALLYFMTTGEVPQDAMSRYDFNTGKDSLKPPHSLVSTIPVWLSTAVITGMALKAADRPQTVAALLELLNQQLNQQQAISRPTRRLWRFAVPSVVMLGGAAYAWRAGALDLHRVPINQTTAPTITSSTQKLPTPKPHSSKKTKRPNVEKTTSTRPTTTPLSTSTNFPVPSISLRKDITPNKSPASGARLVGTMSGEVKTPASSGPKYLPTALGSQTKGTVGVAGGSERRSPTRGAPLSDKPQQPTTVGKQGNRGWDVTPIMTSRPSSSADFSVPSGSLRAGVATTQGRALGSSAVGTISGGPGTQDYAGPEFSVSAPGLRASGAPGAARTRGRLSPNVGAPLNERTGRPSPDGTYGVVGPNTVGTRVASAAVRGNSTGSYNPAGVAGGTHVEGGRNRGIAGTPGGRGTGLRGAAITGTGDGRPTGNGTGRGGGVAGVREFRAGSGNGRGVGEGGGPGFTTGGSAPSVEAGTKSDTPKVISTPTIVPEQSGQTKSTRDAEAIFQPEIDFPESVRGQNFSSSVVARVTIYANGTSSATLTKDSGNAEVDRAVLNTLKRWKWKAAIQDGSPVTSTKSVNIRLSNK